jgi:hypothetical protein
MVSDTLANQSSGCIRIVLGAAAKTYELDHRKPSKSDAYDFR